MVKSLGYPFFTCRHKFVHPWSMFAICPLPFKAQLNQSDSCKMARILCTTYWRTWHWWVSMTRRNYYTRIWTSWIPSSTERKLQSEYADNHPVSVLECRTEWNLMPKWLQIRPNFPWNHIHLGARIPLPHLISIMLSAVILHKQRKQQIGAREDGRLLDKEDSQHLSGTIK